MITDTTIPEALKQFDELIAQIAYKPPREATDEDRRLWRVEAGRCQVSFHQFLKYVKIIDPPTPNNPGGVIPFQLWPHLEETIKALFNYTLIVILKSRQIGISWLLAAYALWYAITHQGTHIMLFSKGEREAWELLAKCRRIWSQLPCFLQPTLKPDSLEELGFPAILSSIKAFPATETAGVSYTASMIICDEWDVHPNATSNFINAKPTIDAGGQFIGVFTVDKRVPDTLAKNIFRDALERKNDFFPLFFSWAVRPGRDAEWYEEKKRNTPDTDLDGLTRALYMEQNYPGSIEEALSRSETIAVFDKHTLNSMKDDCRSQINFPSAKWDEIDNNIIHIYKDFHVGNFYIAGTDVSLGVGKDYNVTVVMDVKTGDIVADIVSQFLAPEELALHSMNLLKIYHNPVWWIEQNLWGRTVIKKAIDLGYKRLGYRGDNPIGWTNINDADLKRVGFVTEEKSRADLFGLLIPAINDHQIRIYNLEGLNQFYGIMRNADKKGRIEAMSHQHDDYVMAVGICWLKKDTVKTQTTWKPVATLDFGNVRRRSKV